MVITWAIAPSPLPVNGPVPVWLADGDTVSSTPYYINILSRYLLFSAILLILIAFGILLLVCYSGHARDAFDYLLGKAICKHFLIPKVLELSLHGSSWLLVIGKIRRRSFTFSLEIPVLCD